MRGNAKSFIITGFGLNIWSPINILEAFIISTASKTHTCLRFKQAIFKTRKKCIRPNKILYTQKSSTHEPVFRYGFAAKCILALFFA